MTMSSSTEATTSAHDHDAHREEDFGPSQTAQSQGTQVGDALAGRLGTALARPPADTLLSNRALRLSSNSSVRSVAFRQAQRSHGNQFVQRAILRSQRSAS